MNIEEKYNKLKEWTKMFFKLPKSEFCMKINSY